MRSLPLLALHRRLRATLNPSKLPPLDHMRSLSHPIQREDQARMNRLSFKRLFETSPATPASHSDPWVARPAPDKFIGLCRRTKRYLNKSATDDFDPGTQVKVEMGVQDLPKFFDTQVSSLTSHECHNADIKASRLAPRPIYGLASHRRKIFR
jgi:hypothetical protein